MFILQLLLDEVSDLKLNGILNDFNLNDFKFKVGPVKITMQKLTV